MLLWAYIRTTIKFFTPYQPIEMTQQQQIKEMIEWRKKRIQKKKSDPRAYWYNIDMTAWFCEAMEECVADLTKLQAEQPQILPSLNMSDYKKWYSEWLKQSEIIVAEREKTRTSPRPMILPEWVQIIQPKQDVDIDELMDLIWEFIENRDEYEPVVRDMITKHLTQKTTVPKDEEVVEINKKPYYADLDTRCYKCTGCDTNFCITSLCKYCPRCWAEIKRID